MSEWIRPEKTVSFVAKLFKAKTRKDKDYFVYRFNMPKEIAEKLSLKEEDYLVFSAHQAKWYHLIDWDEMETAWSMLPNETKDAIRASGLLESARDYTLYPMGVRTMGYVGGTTHGIFVSGLVSAPAGAIYESANGFSGSSVAPIISQSNAIIAIQ